MGAVCCGERTHTDDDDELESLIPYEKPTEDMDTEVANHLKELIEQAGQAGTSKRLRTLLEKGTPTDTEAYRNAINLQELDTGYTALMYAASNAKLEKVKTLLNNKATVRKLEKRGLSALHLAAKSNDSASAAVTIELLKAGGDRIVNIAVPDTLKTALHFAAESGNTGVVTALLDGGADPKLKNSDGLTPADMTSASTLKELINTPREKTISSVMEYRAEVSVSRVSTSSASSETSA